MKASQEPKFSIASDLDQEMYSIHIENYGPVQDCYLNGDSISVWSLFLAIKEDSFSNQATIILPDSTTLEDPFDLPESTPNRFEILELMEKSKEKFTEIKMESIGSILESIENIHEIKSILNTEDKRNIYFNLVFLSNINYPIALARCIELKIFNEEDLKMNLTSSDIEKISEFNNIFRDHGNQQYISILMSSSHIKNNMNVYEIISK